MKGVELRHLRALVALTEEGTFTDAAIRLGVTQSAVSRMIVALEDALDIALVERTTRSVALTAAGVRCYRAAGRALAAVDEVASAAHDRSRPLRVGYSWAALGRHTSEVLRRWRATRPEIPLEVHRVDDRSAGLSRGLVDVAVVRGPVDVAEFDPTEVAGRVVFAERRMAAVPHGHPLADRVSIELADLRHSTVLVTANGTTRLDLWPADRRPTRSLHVDNIDEWLTEIAGGVAVGVTTEATAELHVHPGVRYLPVTDAAAVDVSLVWPARDVHPAAEDFCALVRGVVTGDG